MKSLNEKELADKLKSYSINYINWPFDIKNGFKTTINQDEGTRAYELKKN